MPSYLCVTPILARRSEGGFPLALAAVIPALQATGMDVGPAVTSLILIAMTATVLWKRAREVR